MQRIGAMFEAFRDRQQRLETLTQLLQDAIEAEAQKHEQCWDAVAHHVEMWLNDAVNTLTTVHRVLQSQDTPDQMNLNEDGELHIHAHNDGLHPFAFALNQLGEIMNIRRALAERRPQDLLRDLKDNVQRYANVEDKTIGYAMEWLNLDPAQPTEQETDTKRPTLQ